MYGDFFTKTVHENQIVYVNFRGHSIENILTSEALTHFENIIDELFLEKEIAGVIFGSDVPNFFFQGPSVLEVLKLGTFEKAKNFANRFQKLFKRVEEFKMTTVAAISGRCSGVGLEFALSCQWRVCDDLKETQFAFSEIHNGLSPLGRTASKLIKIVGLQKAIDLLLTGRKMTSEKAQALGIVDACVPSMFLYDQAHFYALKTRHKDYVSSKSLRFKDDLPKWAFEGNALGRMLVLKKTKDHIDEKTRGFYPAHYKILELIQSGVSSQDATLINEEVETFSQLALTKQAQALCHLALADSKIKSINNTLDVSSVCIVGVSQGICDIAVFCLAEGLRVRLVEKNTLALGRALKTIFSLLCKKIDRGDIKNISAQQLMAKVTPSHNLQNLKFFPIVLMCGEVSLKDLEENLKRADSSLQTNQALILFNCPTPLVGLQSFAPRIQNLISLHALTFLKNGSYVEISHIGDASSVDKLEVFCAKIGKKSIRIKDSPANFSMRILAYYWAESLKLFHEGNSVSTIDGAMLEFGFIKAPFNMMDEFGLEPTLQLIRTMMEYFPSSLWVDAEHVLLKHLSSGKFGRVNLKGFYSYKIAVNPDFHHNQDDAVRDLRNEIVDRVVMIIINEAVKALEESVISDPGVGDLLVTSMVGFPSFWGGPFKYVDFIDASNAYEQCMGLEKTHGKRFHPQKLLETMHEQRKKFFSNEPWQML